MDIVEFATKTFGRWSAIAPFGFKNNQREAMRITGLTYECGSVFTRIAVTL